MYRLSCPTEFALTVVHSCLAVAGIDFVPVCILSADASGFRHIHVSLRDSAGNNVFAVSDAELKTGRVSAANDATKFISQEAEWFLAGILDGLPDGA